MKLKSVFYLVFAFAILSCNAQTSANIKTVEVGTFAKEIKTNSKPQLLDVRTPEEFTAGHLEKSTNINWLGDNFVEETKTLDKNKAVYVYCRSGKRSLKAAEKLSELGFKNIYNLDGGYLKWTESNELKTAK